MKENTFAAIMAVLLLIAMGGIIFLGLAWGAKQVFGPSPAQYCLSY